MINDSVRMDRVFANWSDDQIATVTKKVDHLVHIMMGIVLIVAGIYIVWDK